MSKQITPFAPVATAVSRQVEVDAILEEYDGDIDLPETGQMVLKLILANLSGKIKFSPSEASTLQKLMQKLVPDAPKRIEVETRIAPETYLKEALSYNQEAFNRMAATARDFIPEVEAKTLAVREVLQMKMTTEEEREEL